MEPFMSPFIVPVGIMFAIAFMVVGTAFAKALGRKWDRDARTSIPTDVAARLERMEHAIDAIAVEVERISEGQRFTTKLLTSRQDAGMPADRVQERAGGGVSHDR